MNAKNKIRVFIIDDSAVIRHLLTEIFSSAPDIEVIGTGIDPVFSRQKLRGLQPDVITLDVEMPRMDGLSFLEEIMRTNPVPVVMVSAMTQRGSETAIRALELGAVDYVAKPQIDVKQGIIHHADELLSKVRMAARATVLKPLLADKRLQPEMPRIKAPAALAATTDRIIAIGASTGGTQAITEILTRLHEACSGIVIAQHMPPMFTSTFAKRLDMITRLDAKEAAGGDRVIRGSALIAPGDRHLKLVRRGAMYYTELSDEPPVNFSKPSVDVLFRSVAHAAGKNAMGILLTGMGEDGARGLREMREAGAYTIAQDEKSSVVYGMPAKAVEFNAVERVLPLDQIAAEILRFVGK